MKTISLKGKKHMNNRSAALEELLGGPSMTIDPELLEGHSITEVSPGTDDPQKTNRQLLKNKKPNYSLYEVFLSVQGLLDKCTPTLDEMFTKDAEGKLIYSEAGVILASTSTDNKTLMDDALELFRQVDGVPNKLRKGFIKDKIIPNRFSRRGAEYVQQFDTVGEQIFSLSTLCLTIQMALNDLVTNNPVEE